MENERLIAEAKRTAEQKKAQMSKKGVTAKKEVDARVDAVKKATERDKGDRLAHVAEGQSAMRLQSEYKREMLEIDESLERDRHFFVMENERLIAEAKRTAEQKKAQMSKKGVTAKKEVDARVDATLTTGAPDEALPDEADAGPTITDANAQYTREMAAIEEEAATAIRTAEEERDHLIREAASAAGEEQEYVRQKTLEQKIEAEEKMKGAEKWLRGE
ncbi:hypothetical protein HZA87_02835, partial [Candidatus Uhrbacteria bacterium]|nr:hypothetical protein [Candidatus Uhrbacteria bacterium]